MPTYTMLGESGKQFNPASNVSLHSLNIKDATVNFRSLGTDTYVYSMEIEADTPSSDIPERWQSITLIRDANVFLKGIVTAIEESVTAGNHLITVTVSGPWWFAENTPLTTSQTSPAGISGERQSFQASAQNLKTTIEGVITRGSAMGIPWTLGTVSSYFTFPQITLSSQTVAQALSELVRMCPDAYVWFDYSTSTPTIHVTRRGDASRVVISMNSTHDVTGYSITPVPQFQISQVRIPYCDRVANGRRRNQVVTSGSFAAGRIQVLTVSGPELDTYLPPDPPVESVVLKTIPTGGVASSFDPFVNAEIPEIKRLIDQYGSQWYGPSPTGQYLTTGGVASDGVVNLYSSSSGTSGRIQFQTFKPKFLDANKNAVSGHFLYPSIRIPDWLNIQGTPVTYQIMYLVQLRWDSSDFPSQPTSAAGLQDFASTASSQQNRFTQSTPYDRISIFWMIFEGEGLVLPAAYSNQTVYRPPDYNFVSPPSGFSSNLLAAQSWLPYEGYIDFMDGTVGPRHLGKIVLFGSRLTEHQDMEALYESESINLISETRRLNIGSPPRIDYKNILDKIRRTPQDNIIPA